MKNKTLTLLGACVYALFNLHSAFAQGTAFVYEGRLNDGGSAANGLYDLEFRLFASGSGGAAVAGPLSSAPVNASNGLFTVTLDFGSGVFTGAPRWLEIGVRTNGSVSAYAVLSPRQQITPSPYAVFAGNAGTSAVASSVASGAVSLPQLNTLAGPSTGQVLAYDGSSLVWTNPPPTGGWGLTGNMGTAAGVNFLGTLDNQPLELWSYGIRGLRLEYTSRTFSVGNFLSTSAGMNVIGGFWGNTIANTVLGGTIAGGGIQSGPLFAPTYEPNTVTDDFGTVGGGYANTAANRATVPGGYNNSATGRGSFAAGRNAHTSYDGAFVWGDGTVAAVGGGANRFEALASGGANFYTGDNPLTVFGPWLVATGLGNEQGYIGGDGVGGDVQVGSLNPTIANVAFYNAASQSYMHIYCSSITIMGGADLAEPFQLSRAASEIPPGAVVVIDENNPGHLKMSNSPYDARVAGALSGANGINAGIQLHQQGLIEGGKNVALSGRVYVLADATYGPIRPGDQLTTSGTPGHAMKVSDHARAQGAVLGKAMTGLADGKGMVLVLVTLQ